MPGGKHSPVRHGGGGGGHGGPPAGGCHGGGAGKENKPCGGGGKGKSPSPHRGRSPCGGGKGKGKGGSRSPSPGGKCHGGGRGGVRLVGGGRGVRSVRVGRWRCHGGGGGGFKSFSFTKFGVPKHFLHWFTTGQLSWLTPDRWALLKGGRWEQNEGVWITASGQKISQRTPEWVTYFGSFRPRNLTLLFGGSGGGGSPSWDWDTNFKFLTPDFLQQWTQLKVPEPSTTGASGFEVPTSFNFGQFGVPQDFVPWFASGQLTWLTPQRWTLLQGGKWDTSGEGGGVWITSSGLKITPDSPDWDTYFGDFEPEDLTLLLGGDGDGRDGDGKTSFEWDTHFKFLTPDFLNKWVEVTADYDNYDDFSDDSDSDGGGKCKGKGKRRGSGGKCGRGGRGGFGRWRGFGGQGRGRGRGGRRGGWRKCFKFDWVKFGVPKQFIHWFLSGRLSWLTPERWNLLKGGRWDSSESIWITSSGQRITPGSSDWIIYFGCFKPQYLTLLFGGGGGCGGHGRGHGGPKSWSWDEHFGWLNADFFGVWSQEEVPEPDWVSVSVVVPTAFDWTQFGIPEDDVHWFSSGELGWLTPARWDLLKGGRWDLTEGDGVWVTASGAKILPDSDDWDTYFGNCEPEDLTILFGEGETSWDARFSFLTPQFLEQWVQLVGDDGDDDDDGDDGGSKTTVTAVNILPTPPQNSTLVVEHIVEENNVTVVHKVIHHEVVVEEPLPPPPPAPEPAPEPTPTPAPTPAPVSSIKIPDPPIVPSLKIEIPSSFNFTQFGIPQDFVRWFTSGQLSWLTPERWTLLQGGRWDIEGGSWINGTGHKILPGTAEWTAYFGDFKPDNLNLLFGGGETSWDAHFHFLNPQFLQQWTQIVRSGSSSGGSFGFGGVSSIHFEIPAGGVLIPSQYITVFQGGQMNWLTPERFALLKGGKWDNGKKVWINAGGKEIGAGSLDWIKYFGTVNPELLGHLFADSGSWETVFGFINEDFFKNWKGWMPFGGAVPPATGGIVIPSQIGPFFQGGQMNWLNPDRFKLLQGGGWDAVNKRWINAQGEYIVPGSLQWMKYFGTLNPDLLGQLFPHGGGWTDVFGFINVDTFFNNWRGWMPFGGAPRPAGAGVMIPTQLATFFQGGQMNWLNPDRFKLLQGGGWDSVNSRWINAQGAFILPGSAEWTTYFGDMDVKMVGHFFPYGGTWEDVFGFIDASFFESWPGWRQVQQIEIPAGASFGMVSIPHQFVQLFQSAQFSWLNEERVRLLMGGRWNGSAWITAEGTQIAPGSGDWTKYFGDFSHQNMSLLFPGGSGSWNEHFSFFAQSGFWQFWQMFRAQGFGTQVSAPAPPPPSAPAPELPKEPAEKPKWGMQYREIE